MAKTSQEQEQEILRLAAAGLSHRAIAERIGCNQATVSKVKARAAKATTSKPAADPSEPVETAIIERENYVYNEQLDKYITFTRRGKVVLSGESHREMLRAYSNWDGQAATINEICRKFGITRATFQEYRKAHGWTHDLEPFTAEELSRRAIDELAEDALQQKREALYQRYNRRDWQETQKDADRWRNLEQSFIVPLIGRIEALAPSYTVPRLNLGKARRPFALVTSSGELHYGKAGWKGETGEEYSREIADERIALATAAMLEEVAYRGTPEEVIYIVGNDDLHIDNIHGATSKGTPQDADGTAVRIFDEYLAIQKREIDRIRAVAPVRIQLSRGNHNRLLSYAMMRVLEAMYSDAPDVQVNTTAKFRSYFSYGATLAGCTHGDSTKPKDLMQLMLQEATELIAGSLHRVWFTGHLHDEEVKKLVGGKMYQMPSLSGMDRYHHEHGYHGTAGLTGYILDKQLGPVCSLICPVAH